MVYKHNTFIQQLGTMQFNIPMFLKEFFRFLGLKKEPSIRIFRYDGKHCV